jgi:hypothetical protein
MQPNIDYVSVLDDIQDIDERNKAFKKLTKEGKRLEIAWDMLKLLMQEKIKASNGWYWSDKLFNVADKCGTPEDLHKKLNQDSKFKGCSVCARGGIMLSQIRLGNTVAPKSYAIDRGDSSILDGFSIHSMRRMEAEYEIDQYSHPYYRHTREKLMNILCNVLVNGDFKVSDKTNYLIV